MIVLTIGNSYSVITGLSRDQEKTLRAKLSYVVGGKSAYYSSFGPRKKSLIDKRGSFPTGLLSRVYAELDCVNITIKDSRIKPKLLPYDIKLPYVPYKSQLCATDTAIAHHRGIISMATGTGKSILIGLIASRLGVRTLVVVPSLEIKKQLQKTLESCKMVTIENIDAVTLNMMKDFDCLIIDEAHHVAAKTYHKLNKIMWNGIYYRFFLTATPFRNDLEESLLFESIAGQVIYTLNYKEAVKEGYIVPVEGYYIEIPKKKTDAYTYKAVYSELVVNNQARNSIIANLLISLQQNNVFTLCLVREVLHGQILSSLTGMPFVNGEDDTSRNYIQQFNRGEIKTLIGTTGILGEGVDTKPCEYVVIAGLGKAKSQFMQQVGRAVRQYSSKNSAKVILFQDKSHKFLTRHFNIQKAILKEEYSVTCEKLDYKITILGEENG